MAFALGNQFANLLFGTVFPDLIVGLNGNDTLIGGQGSDTLSGGNGSDTANYATSFEAVQVDIGGANTGGTAEGDVFFDIENVTGSAFNDRITGNGQNNVLNGLGGADTLDGKSGDDTLLGGDGSDVLNGGAGDDSMVGGNGNDTYVVDSFGDRVNETGGSGIDTVQSSRSINLSSAQFTGDVENVRLTGSADHSIIGNDLANTLRGNAGNNVIKGGLGSDTMVGGAGDDIYVVNSGGDVVDEAAAGSGGTDTVNSAVTFSLRGAQVAGTQNEVEILRLSGTLAINGSGNDLDNTLLGNSGDNALTGFAGNDTLTGGGGADSFVFRSALNANTNVDTITDFSVAQDTIRLENLFMPALSAGALDPDAFRTGGAAADAEDRIIYHRATGTLFYDEDGVGSAAAVQFAVLDAGLVLTSADFLVS